MVYLILLAFVLIDFAFQYLVYHSPHSLGQLAFPFNFYPVYSLLETFGNS